MSQDSIDMCVNATVETEKEIAIKTAANESDWNIASSEGGSSIQFYEEKSHLVKAGLSSNTFVELSGIKNEPHEFNEDILVSDEKHVKPYACSKCDSAFTHINDLSKHVSTYCGTDSAKVMKIKRFSCNECDCAFTERERLALHLETVHGKMSIAYKRNVADSKFPVVDFIPDERSNVIESYEGKTRCIKQEQNESNRMGGELPESSYVGDSRSIGSRQVRSHICFECEKSFYNKGHLNQHISAVHLKLKNFVCSLCNRGFSRLALLKSHLNAIHGKLNATKIHLDATHNKLKNFVCGECDRAFTEKGSLKVHLEGVHRKLKKFSCGECESAFTRQVSLKKHLNVVHKKIKKFTCGECDRSFAAKWTLIVHLDAVHRKLKKYLCAECSLAFGHRSNLMAHIKKNHQSS